jgi:phenylpropionate dioxygenase-like ring-hydroxylating dioxygenase large terminal subunit
MTTAAENKLLTETAPGTPMGNFMRQFWIPALKSSELVADGDPVRLMLLNEKLIAFRDTQGKIGVMDHRCPHRCASLFFGRNEEGGIRCVYHGWKFDTEGNCLDMANVPPHQDFKHKVHAKAYRTAERNGVVYVYMGEAAELPPLPEIESTLLPNEQIDVHFIHRESNWLQGAEGELDTSHIGFLHFGLLGKGQMAGQGENKFAVANRAPEYKSLETDFGYMYAAYRPAEADETYWRFGQFLFPFWTMPPIGHIRQNLLTRAYVPIDDNNCMIVVIEKKDIVEEPKGVLPKGHPGGAFDPDSLLPNTTDWMGRWRLRQNRANDYEIDRDRQRSDSYTGMDTFILQDQMITESMGEIVDRTWEHLAPSDVMITRVRRCILRAVQEFEKDKTLPATATDPAVFAGVRGGFFVEKSDVDWQEAYKKQVANAPLEQYLGQAAE